MTDKAKRIICGIAFLVTVITSTASSCTGKPVCDVSGPSTMLTVCAYEVVTGK